MSYTLNYSGGTITVYDNSLNEETSLALPGRNYSGYGSPVDQDLVYLLENFASNTTEPANAIKGQIWFQPGIGSNFLSYNTSDIKGSPEWVTVAGSGVDMDVSFGSVTFAPKGTAPSSPAAGQTYYDLTKNKISYWNNSSWVELPPAATNFATYGPGVAIGSSTQANQVNWYTGNVSQMLLWANRYNDGTNRYSSTGFAGALGFDKTTGDWQFSNSVSGTKDLAVTSTPRLTIKNTGQVGIGTDSPESMLDILDTSGSGSGYINVRSSSPAVLAVGSGNAFDAGGAGAIFTTESYPLIFGTQSAERMRIDASGNVGIGGTPTKTLDVAGTFKVSGAVTLNGQTYTFPSSAGTNGYALTTNGAGVLSWAAAGTGSLPAENLVGAIPSAVTAVTQPLGNNTTKIATTAFVQVALGALYPIGSIYINATNSTNPGTLLGFGTWVAFGAGKVPVGYDSTNTLFNAGEKLYGFADTAVVTHNHGATTTLSSTTHTHSGTTDGSGSHTHNFVNVQAWNAADNASTPVDGITGTSNSDGGRVNYPSATLQGTAYLNTVGNHTHTFSTGNNSATPTASTSIANNGVAGTNLNYQPSITVFMWKRTG